MQLTRGYSAWRGNERVIATIGNFDGMHRGHQAIMQRLNALSAEHQLPTCAITFQPLPHEVFSQNTPLPRLQGLRNRLLSLQNHTIDHCLLLPFTESLRSLSAKEFTEKVLVDALQVHTLIVGDDFHFGHKRSGSFSTLQEAGSTHGFHVEDTPTVLHDGERISSTRVRDALQQNDLSTAAALLGTPYSISGRVFHGEKIGRQMGFPTANIALKNQIPPLQGVFAVTASCGKTQQSWNGVANLGRRPTVNGLKLLLEVHMLDATVDLYGKHLSIEFQHFIRGEQKFASLEELKQQIQRDADSARAFFHSGK